MKQVKWSTERDKSGDGYLFSGYHSEALEAQIEYNEPDDRAEKGLFACVWVLIQVESRTYTIDMPGFANTTIEKAKAWCESTIKDISSLISRT